MRFTALAPLAAVLALLLATPTSSATVRSFSTRSITEGKFKQLLSTTIIILHTPNN